MAGKGAHPWSEELQKIAESPEAELFGAYAVAFFGFDNFEPKWTVFRRDGDLLRYEDRGDFARVLRLSHDRDGAVRRAKDLAQRDEKEAQEKASREEARRKRDEKRAARLAAKAGK